MLILFDIDMTLVNTHGVGMACLEEAGRSLFGSAFNARGIEFGGRLDPLIIHDLLVNAGLDPHAEHARALRSGYSGALSRAFDRDARSDALPGTPELVEALAEIEGVTLGLLTGNFQETGTLKVQRAGFDIDRFPIRVWGDESPHAPPARAHLPPVGIERFAVMHARPIDPARVVIIGDTVHDVSCALDNGCRALAVATGHHDAERLAQSGAHRVVENLARTQDVVRWLTAPLYDPLYE